jgi:hypothetical protein
MITVPDNDELRSWSTQKEAKYFISLLKADYEDTKEDIVNGVYSGETSDMTAQLIGKALGKCQNLQDMIYVLENFGKEEEEKEDEEV